MNVNELYEIEKKLTLKLKSMENEVLGIYNYIGEQNGRGVRTLPSMHAIIGSKNNTFVDSIRTQFMNPNDFIQQWIKGLLDINEKYRINPNTGEKHNNILIYLLKNYLFREYAFTFLERNFYKNLQARTRYKPNEVLWELWIGSGNFVYGLLLTPVFRSGEWTNDVSEIRRASYKYWTIGHVMTVGIVDPESTEKIIFRTYDDLFTFYRSTLKKMSNSLYEKELFDRYIKYLKLSNNIDDEPLLIPEIRYAGLEKQHKYRLDFTILNSHTQEYIGFELSPSSSHMSVSGIKSGKTQTQMNIELSKSWEKEMEKRNSYFSDYGISIITFTDENLKDMDSTFNTIENYLKNRSTTSTTINQQMERLMRI